MNAGHSVVSSFFFSFSFFDTSFCVYWTFFFKHSSAVTDGGSKAAGREGKEERS